MICPNCQHELPTQFEPIEPLYDVRNAAELIPYRPSDNLLAWLNRRKEEFPARYRVVHLGSRARQTRVRVLTHTEVLKIRKAILRGPGNT